MQYELILKLESKGSCCEVENKKGETPITLCLEKENIEGLKLLLNEQMNLQTENSSGSTLLHYFSHLASEGLEGIQFVIERLQLKEEKEKEKDKKYEERNKLRDALKRTDINGFEAILFFVRDFTSKVKSNFNKRVKILREAGGV